MGVRLCPLAKMLFLAIERLRIGEGREFQAGGRAVREILSSLSLSKS